MNPPKFFTLVTSLLYPAFLGAWIYEALDKFPGFDGISALLIVALVMHYIADYLYLLEERNKEYGLAQAIIDVVILACIYISLKLSLSAEIEAKVHLIWELMVIMKALATAWEVFHRYLLGFVFDLAFFCAYSIGAYYSPDKALVLAIIILLDAAAYPVHDWVKERYGFA
jgi:hypothetical protein